MPSVHRTCSSQLRMAPSPRPTTLSRNSIYLQHLPTVTTSPHQLDGFRLRLPSSHLGQFAEHLMSPTECVLVRLRAHGNVHLLHAFCSPARLSPREQQQHLHPALHLTRRTKQHLTHFVISKPEVIFIPISLHSLQIGVVVKCPALREHLRQMSQSSGLLLYTTKVITKEMLYEMS